MEPASQRKDGAAEILVARSLARRRNHATRSPIASNALWLTLGAALTLGVALTGLDGFATWQSARDNFAIKGGGSGGAAGASSGGTSRAIKPAGSSGGSAEVP